MVGDMHSAFASVVVILERVGRITNYPLRNEKNKNREFSVPFSKTPGRIPLIFALYWTALTCPRKLVNEGLTYLHIFI